jgi:hypothetical protein
VSAASKLVSDQAKDVSDKKNLMTSNPDTQEEPQEIKEPQEINIGPAKYTPPTYVVPESEAWNNMSPEEQLAMTMTALQREEGHKFFGGREVKKGGFLGFGGERTLRFSEDNSGQTPEETARLNRQAKLLNKLLDDNNKKAEQEMEEGRKLQAELNRLRELGKGTVSEAVESGKNVARFYASTLNKSTNSNKKYIKKPVVNLKSPSPYLIENYLNKFI